MAKATKTTTTAADLAARYRVVRIQCLVCRLGPERVEIVRQLRHDHGLSFQEIAKAIGAEFGQPLMDGAVRQHFINHVRTAA